MEYVCCFLLQTWLCVILRFATWVESVNCELEKNPIEKICASQVINKKSFELPQTLHSICFANPNMHIGTRISCARARERKRERERDLLLIREVDEWKPGRRSAGNEDPKEEVKKKVK